MTNRSIEVGRTYVQAIYDRAAHPMEPDGFSPNLSDRPSHFKVYYESQRIPLPIQHADRFPSLDQILCRLQAQPGTGTPLSIEALAAMLWLGHGVTGRRLRICWNRNNANITRYERTLQARSAPSGGGMYPTEIYLACGESGTLLPGVYHYHTLHHTLERLLSADVTARVREALLEHPAAHETDQFLLIALNFWKNAWKYNNFCYHVVTQDAGILYATLRLVALGLGSDLPVVHWFADGVLNQIIGLDTFSESVFAAIPLPALARVEQQAGAGGNGRLAPLDVPGGRQGVLVDQPSYQRSKQVRSFDTVEAIHHAALVEAEPRPAHDAAWHAAVVDSDLPGQAIPLPPPGTLKSGLLETLQARQSSFGRLSHHLPIRLGELGTLLHTAAAFRNYGSDLKPADGKTYFTRLMLFANNVEGLARGTYAYDACRQCLVPAREGDFRFFLQKVYFLKNYNVAEASAVIVVVGRPERMLEVYGNRGHRILNADVGIVAQGVHIAAAALGVGCGAALGFDQPSYSLALGLDGTDECPLLALFLGHERGAAAFDISLVH